MTDETAPFLLVPRQAYTTKKSLLDENRQRLVDEAEQDIALNPSPVEDWWTSATGGTIDFSRSDDGFMIEYQVDSRLGHEHEIELLDLIDIATAAKVRRWPVESE